jgi:nitroreductase
MQSAQTFHPQFHYFEKSKSSTMTEQAEIFDEIVRARRSVRLYESDTPVEEAAVQRSLDRALLSPNSSNLQLWEFYRVKNTDKKKELATYCLGQRAARTAQELIVVVARKDKWKEHAKFILDESKKDFPNTPGKQEKLMLDYYGKVIPTLYMSDPLDIFGTAKKILAFGAGLFRPTPREVNASDMRVVVHKSAALAAQTFMLSMQAEGYDTCPMEGFDSARVKKMLQLPGAAEITMIISIGKGKPEGIYSKRLRLPREEVIFEI